MSFISGTHRPQPGLYFKPIPKTKSQVQSAAKKPTAIETEAKQFCAKKIDPNVKRKYSSVEKQKLSLQVGY